MSKKILILGANGFIGSSLSEEILKKTDWEVFGLDLTKNRIEPLLENANFHFFQGDMLKEKQWVTDHVQSCDIILPLVAIASPLMYVQDPLRVFELDFEANLEIIRKCVAFKKRVIFPSTSEVYGMCNDEEFDEDTSSFVLGPIAKQRWIYSSSKQLLDRVIYAHGIQDNLDYTLFRPFNWVGSGLDTFEMAKKGSARVVTQFIHDILEKKEIHLVDGGLQRRCFTDISDGIAALMRIIENKDNCAFQKIFNIGNPNNDWTIRSLAEKLIDLLSKDPEYGTLAAETKIMSTEAAHYYGNHYQDVSRRVPSIKKAFDALGWAPTIDVPTMLKKVVDDHLCALKQSKNHQAA